MHLWYVPMRSYSNAAAGADRQVMRQIFAADAYNDHYGVIGYPIAHSLSPRIHAAFAEETGQALRYHAFSVPPGQFEEALTEFQRAGGRGLNITIPFKEEARRLVHRMSERAQVAGAINTVCFNPEGRRYGDNTDGVGFLRDFVDNHGGRLTGRQVLILGAGGAVRGLLGPLLAQGPARTILANRTVAKAQALERRFSTLGAIESCAYSALYGQSFDVIINTIPSGLTAELPPLPAGILAQGGWCYDLVYGPDLTPFLRWGVSQGAVCILDGLGMLVEQASEAFYLWRGLRPTCAPVIQRLRSANERPPINRA